MPSLKSLSLRLRSVTSTQKITKAMKLVAASKLRGATAKMEAARPFAASINPLMVPSLEPKEGDEISSETILAISSDKGLCGGINSRIVKQIKLEIDAAVAAGSSEPGLILFGSKARDGLTRTHGQYINMSMDEGYMHPITFSLASFVTEQLLASPSDKYTILYNKFKSVVAFDVVPLSFKGPEVLGGSGVLDEYEFEGEKEEILADLYQFNMACNVFGCILENSTSEQASRMTAMDSASNNASEMKDKLTLQYNRQRQFVITTELTEIVAGAESI